MSHYRLKQELEDAIFDWLTAILPVGVVVLWDKQSVQGPEDATKEAAPEPLVSLNILAGPDKVGTAGQRFDEDAGAFVYTFHKKFTLSINIYAYQDHLLLMSKILNAMEMPKFSAILRAAGLSAWTASDPRDLSELLNTGYRFRVNTDIVFAYSEEEVDGSDSVGSVVVTGVVNGREVQNTIEGG